MTKEEFLLELEKLGITLTSYQQEQLKKFLAAGYVEITESDGVGVDNTSTPKKKIGRPKKNTI